MSINFNKIPSPCFVLDEKLLVRNLEKLRYVREKADINIILALKGYALWNTFPLVRQYLDGATASSLNEALLINEKMGCKAHTYAPVYTQSEFPEIAALSSHITFNSISQWERYKAYIVNNALSISCGLRINPEYSEVETDLYNPGSPESRLGIKRDILRHDLPDGIDGLHFHLLCENNSHVLERTLNAVEAKFSHLLGQASWINMGGGHLITHADYDSEHLIRLLLDFKKKYSNIKEIILEPGGAVGWQTGCLLSTVEDIVEHEHLKIAMLDVSFAAHMPDCLEMPYKPKVMHATDAFSGGHNYRLGGLTCLAGDYMGMGDYAFQKPLQVGDKVVFEDMIHYTMVKTTFFNGVKHPSIGIWTADDNFVLLREFGFKDYMSKLS